MSNSVRVSNRSRQMIPLQVRPPSGDFYIHENQIRLSPSGKKGSSIILPRNYLNWAQVENCKANGMISVVEV